MGSIHRVEYHLAVGENADVLELCLSLVNIICYVNEARHKRPYLRQYEIGNIQYETPRNPQGQEIDE